MTKDPNIEAAVDQLNQTISECKAGAARIPAKKGFRAKWTPTILHNGKEVWAGVDDPELPLFDDAAAARKFAQLVIDDSNIKYPENDNGEAGSVL